MNVDDVAPIAHTVRNGAVESIHHGIVIAVRGDGREALAVGNGDGAVYPRSALKPLQAEAMLGAGLALDSRRLAIACASHSGEPQHVAAVREILAGAGLDETALQNTPDLPLSADAMADVLRAGGGRTSILQNCSGKHAAMLATCVVNGWPCDGYLADTHPLQQAIARTILDLTGGVAHTGVDGCGAPTAMVGLRGIGAAFRHLATAGCDSYRAMVAHPELVAGPERDDTVVMRAIPGLLVKGGAEGVVVAAHPDGRFVAIKVADGAERARTAVLRVALGALGFDVGRLPPAPILGHGRTVGVVESLVG